MTDMTVRPSSTSPGRTYRWYTGTPVFEFGHGLHYTTFAPQFQPAPAAQYQISQLVAGHSGALDAAPFDTFHIAVRNSGHVASDYVVLLFVKSTNAGPAPHPNKQLVGYTRVHAVGTGKTVQAQVPVTLGSIARADANGNLWVFNGTYQLMVDTPAVVSHTFQLVGPSVQVTHFPQNTTAS